MEFRPKARSGLWLVGLLPLVLFVSKNQISALAFVMSVYSTTLALGSNPNAGLNILTASTWSIKDHVNIRAALACLVILFSLSRGTLIFALSAVAFLIYSWLLPKVFKTCKKSFSFGEGCLVLQSVVIFCTNALISLTYDQMDPTTIEGSFQIIATIGLGSLCFLCTLSYIPILELAINSSLFYTLGLGTVCGFSVPFLWWKLKRDPILWVLQYIFNSKSILGLFAIWSFCLTLAILVVILQSTKATTAARKYFHGIVVVVFTSGAMVDPHFLYLSSIVGLCSMVLLEHMRFKRIEPISSWLRSAFVTFTDEKDVGDLVLTNIYLLAGVALPLWLSPDLNRESLEVLLSGVLSIGIGDSFASIIGSKYGRLKLFGSPKSLEGLIASILSQIAFLQIMQLFNVLTFRPSLIFPIMIVSFVETLTTQVDNVALPLLLYILMKAFQ